MTEELCKDCGKAFNSVDAISMHAKAKHPMPYKKPFLTTQQKKTARNLGIVLLFVGVLVWGGGIALSSANNSSQSLSVVLAPEKVQQIPAGAVHWHPTVNVIIDGEAVPIPTNIGISMGKIVDTHLSGMRMSPLHTHDASGTIHLENNNPSSKPETVTLGYFFYVWGKTFNSECIFEYCNGKGTLKMDVNGNENTEFENYVMRDNDQIRIEYVSNEG